MHRIMPENCHSVVDLTGFLEGVFDRIRI